MLTLEKLSNVVKSLDPCGYCCTTQLDLCRILYPNKREFGCKTFGGRNYVGDEGLFCDYLIQPIIAELKKSGCCFVSLSNNSGMGVTFGHHFTLFLIEGVVYRVESYGIVKYAYDRTQKESILIQDELIYSPRCVCVGDIMTFQKKFSCLVNARDRLSVWNRMFSTKEEKDNEFPHLELKIMHV